DQHTGAVSSDAGQIGHLNDQRGGAGFFPEVGGGAGAGGRACGLPGGPGAAGRGGGAWVSASTSSAVVRSLPPVSPGFTPGGRSHGISCSGWPAVTSIM